MTVEEILHQYDVSFYVSDFGTPFFLAANVMEKMFTFFSSVDDLNEEVLQLVDHYLQGNPFPVDNDLSFFYQGAEVTMQGIRFYHLYTGDLDFLLPLEHFKVIVLAWRDFLEMNTL